MQLISVLACIVSKTCGVQNNSLFRFQDNLVKESQA